MSAFTFREGNITIQLDDHATLYEFLRHFRNSNADGNMELSANVNDMAFSMEMTFLNYYTYFCDKCGIVAQDEDKKCACLDVLSSEDHMRLEGIGCKCGGTFHVPVPNGGE